ncbi:MAG: hypothetical protein E5X69_29165, partial [Mesorhizobium sp.]
MRSTRAARRSTPPTMPRPSRSSTMPKPARTDRALPAQAHAHPSRDVVWGIVGTPYARFSQFVRHPSTVLRYLVAIVRGSEARYVGHNPAGGAMVIVLMAMMVFVAVTGWMETTDAYFGVSWVEDAHSLAAHGLLALVFVH